MKISKSFIGLSLGLVVAFSLIVSTPALAVEKVTSWNQSKVTWNAAPNVGYYNVYFKEVGALKMQHSLRHLPKTSTSADIKFLKKSVSYVYNVSAVTLSGKEFWWSGEKQMKVLSMK